MRRTCGAAEPFLSDTDMEQVNLRAAAFIDSGKAEFLLPVMNMLSEEKRKKLEAAGVTADDTRTSCFLRIPVCQRRMTERFLLKDRVKSAMELTICESRLTI